MKRTLALWGLLLCAPLFGEVFYEQKLHVEFESPQAAKEAQARVAKFPRGKKIAYTTRWDDSNPRQLQLSEVLNARGIKATCYPNALSDNYVKILGKVLGAGNAAGSHTMSHPFLGAMLACEMFNENALQRIHIESRLDTNVVASALPYHHYRSPVWPDSAKILGLCITRAGYMSAPDIGDNATKYSLQDGNVLYSTSLFDANDSNPDEEKYVRELKRALDAAARRGDNHVTLGVHSTQSDDGMKNLGRILDNHHSEDFWYCTENEYCAYRRQTELSSIEKIGAKGKVATFKIRRPAAFTLGSDIGLFLDFDRTATRAKLDKELLKPDGNSLELPHPKAFRIPVKIDHIAFGKTGGANRQSDKFPGIFASFSVDLSAAKISAKISNNSESELSRVRIIAVTAPAYAKSAAKTYAKIPKGGSVEAVFKLEKTEFAKLFEEGRLLYALQIDFLCDSSPSRIYLSKFAEFPIARKECPRDTGMAIGTFTLDELKDVDIARMSSPDTPLKDFKGKSWERTQSDRYAPHTLLLSGKKVKTVWRPDAVILAAIDFEAPSDGEYDIKTECVYLRVYYLNGKRIKLSGSNKVALKAGRNRLIAAARYGILSFSASLGGKELKYLAPQTGNVQAH